MRAEDSATRQQQPELARRRNTMQKRPALSSRQDLRTTSKREKNFDTYLENTEDLPEKASTAASYSKCESSRAFY